MGQPTAKMINFAKDLITQCGYDEDDYNFLDMDLETCSLLIDQLKDDLLGSSPKKLYSSES
jgi:hypothetical protein